MFRAQQIRGSRVCLEDLELGLGFEVGSGVEADHEKRNPRAMAPRRPRPSMSMMSMATVTEQTSTTVEISTVE